MRIADTLIELVRRARHGEFGAAGGRGAATAGRRVRRRRARGLSDEEIVREAESCPADDADEVRELRFALGLES